MNRFAPTAASFALLVSGCSTVLPLEQGGGFLEYTLPRSDVRVDVAWEMRDCRVDRADVDSPWQVQLDVDTTVTFSTVARPDAAAPVRLPFATLSSWTTDANVSVARYDNGILRVLSSKTQDQLPTIASNVFSSATQLVKLAAGLPTGTGLVRGARPSLCGQAWTDQQQLDGLRARLRNPATTPTQATAISRAIAAITERLTIRTTITRNPFTSSNDTRPLLAELQPSRSDLQRAAWVTDRGLDSLISPDGRMQNAGEPMVVRVRYASRELAPPSEAPAFPPGAHIRTPRMFRLTAEVTKAAGTDPEVIHAGELPLAQYGEARTLPIVAGRFETLDWSLTFAQDGTMTDQRFGTTARGVAASSLLLAATSQAEAQRAVLAGASTATLRSEIDELKAEGDLIEARRRLQTLRAGGTP